MATPRHDDTCKDLSDRSASFASGARKSIEDVPPDLIDSPLDLFFAEHYRQRQVAHLLISIADGAVNEQMISAVSDFLGKDLLLHVADEETAFFPALRVVCLPEDSIDRLISILSAEHEEDERAASAVIAVLRAIRDRGRAIAVDASALRAFAEHLRRHIALENGVLLPIARARFDSAALRALAEALKARRGPGH